MKPPSPKKHATLYAIRDYSHPPKLDSCEVVQWGTGWRAINSSTLAFGCRSQFAADQYAQSPSEAWERYVAELRESIAHHEREISTDRQNIAFAEKALRECQTPESLIEKGA